MNALSNDMIKTEIIDYERKVFSEDQKWVDEVTEILSWTFCVTADQSKTVKNNKSNPKQKLRKNKNGLIILYLNERKIKLDI